MVTPTQDVTVRMFITSEKLRTGPTRQFNRCVFRPLDEARQRFSLSVDIPVCSMSDTSARNMAGQMLRESLDVIAYMVGKGDITVGLISTSLRFGCRGYAQIRGDCL
jgi:hypothetical protein